MSGGGKMRVSRSESEDESEKKVTKKRTTPKVKLSSPKKDEEKNEGDDLEKSYESKSRKVKKMAVNEGKVDYDSHSSMDSDDEAFIPEYESDVLEDTGKYDKLRNGQSKVFYVHALYGGKLTYTRNFRCLNSVQKPQFNDL